MDKAASCPTSETVSTVRAPDERQIAYCQTHFLEGEGHLFIYGERWRDILLRLLDRSGQLTARPA
jgi:hypothetical protein